MGQADVYRMIRRGTADAGIETKIGCHTFPAAGITKYLRNGGKLEVAQQIGYLSNEWFDDGGIYITAPLDPPKGVQLTKTRVPWANVKKIEFIEWGPGKETKARLTTLDGRSREVYLFCRHGSDDTRTWQHPRITGKIKIGDVVEEAQIEPGFELKVIEFQGK